MRRGLTMVETLVALGILSSLMLVVAAWTRVATQTGGTATEAVHWRLAADAVLELVHDDLVSGDVGPASARQRADPERVEIENGVLRIHARSTATGDARGPATYHYILESGLLRREQRVGQAGRQVRPLIDMVSAWTCEIDEDKRLLRVAITFQQGMVARRTFRLP